MRVICTANVKDDRQKANLCECIGILGGKPIVEGDTIGVEYEGPNATVEKFVELFCHYPIYGICTSS